MSLTGIISNIKNSRILIIGDAMLDDYIEGQISRVSPEAPVLVMHKAQSSLHAGGAANVARNITSLGAKAHLLAVLGNDRRADDLENLLADDAFLTFDFIKDDTRPTTLKTRYLAQGQHLLRSDDECSEALTPKLEAAMLARTQEALKSADYVILSDYAKGVLNESSLSKLIALVRKHHVPVIIDPKKRDFNLFRGADLITPNLHELASASGMAVDSDIAIADASLHIIDKCGIGAVLTTRSEQGMSYVSASDTRHIKAEIRQVFDVAGAGDTVIASLTVSLAAGAEIADAMAFANLAAAVSISKKGTAIVTSEEILHLASHLSPQRRVKMPNEKILSLSELVQQCAAWRSDGLKIGFTNGCFDILHQGHVASLTEAASLCDRLIVGLNDDESVHRLKGEGRPVNGEASRGFVLAGMQAVDRVVFFGEDNPLKLIEAVCPDILFKGEDYQLDSIVGADFVLASGGEVKRLGLVADISTSALIAKMKEV